MILYIHIPFCESKCGYCTFNSYTNANHLKETYLKALLLDIAHTLKQWKKSHKKDTIESIYIGGGTPNMLDSRAYGEIFSLLYSFTPSPKEITIEANPNLLNPQWCKDLRSFGVNRISIGIQSFFDDKLAFLERTHRYKDIFIAIEYARDFSNISVDIMYDTPLDSALRLSQEIDNIALLPINHISAYSLTLEKGSSLYDKYHNSKKSESLSDIVVQKLAQIGFEQYEVSNYHKGYKSLHNLSYWQGREYLGCGAGAYGRIGHIRYHKSNQLESYITNPLLCHNEMLDSRDLDFEEIFLGLRCEIGVALHKLDRQKAQILLDEKKCILHEYNNTSYIRAVDLFLADEIALWLQGS